MHRNIKCLEIFVGFLNLKFHTFKNSHNATTLTIRCCAKKRSESRSEFNILITSFIAFDLTTFDKTRDEQRSVELTKNLFGFKT